MFQIIKITRLEPVLALVSGQNAGLRHIGLPINSQKEFYSPCSMTDTFDLVRLAMLDSTAGNRPRDQGWVWAIVRWGGGVGRLLASDSYKAAYVGLWQEFKLCNPLLLCVPHKIRVPPILSKIVPWQNKQFGDRKEH